MPSRPHAELSITNSSTSSSRRCSKGSSLPSSATGKVFQSATLAQGFCLQLPLPTPMLTVVTGKHTAWGRWGLRGDSRLWGGLCVVSIPAQTVLRQPVGTSHDRLLMQPLGVSHRSLCYKSVCALSLWLSLWSSQNRNLFFC